MTGLAERDATTGGLIGRDTELRRLQAWLRAMAIDGTALCIVGEGGAGKTALLDVAADRAAQAGAQVLRVVGGRSSGRVSLCGLDALLTPLRQRIGELPARNAAALIVALGMRDGPAPTELQIYTATLMLLRRVATARPVAVLVDDAQSIDPASAVALNFVARRVSGSPIGVLMTLRSGSADAIEHSGIPALELAPLDEGSASRLITTRFPAMPTRVVQRLVTDAAGSPMALVELPRSLSPAQRSGQAELPPMLPVAGQLRAMFADRIARLSAAGRDALLLAALTTGETIVHARDLGPRPMPGSHDATGWLHEAHAAGLVTADERHGQVVFHQPLVRSVVVEMSTDLERRRAHRIVAGASAPGTLKQVWHLAQASVAPDEGVAADLERAGRLSLRRGDGRGAVLALSRAAELSAEPGDRIRRLAASAYVGADVTGELRRASGLLADAAGDPGLDDDHRGSAGARGTPLSVATAQAYVLLNRDGDIAAAHSVLVAAINEAVPFPSTFDRASVEGDLGEALHTLMLICFFGGSAQLWLPFHAALRELGPRAPHVLSLCADTFCDPVRRGAHALPQLDAKVADLHLEVDPTAVVRTAMAGFYVDRTAGCREALTRVVADGHAGGAVASAIDAVIALGFDAFATGDWPAAGRLFEEGADACERYGYRLLAWPARFGQALLAAARGDYSTVDTITTEMISWAEPRSARQVRFYANHVRALAALGAGDPAAAFEQTAAISAPGQLEPTIAHALWVMLDTVESAVAAGRRDDACAHVAAMHAAAVAGLSPRYAMVTATAAALVAGSTDATTLFEAALAIPGADRWSFDWARTQLLFGEHLRRRRESSRARHHLRTAVDVFARLGAEPWRSRAAAQLRGAGELLPLQRNNRQSVVLTPHQLRVANLAAVGLTNKQIAARCGTSHRSVGSVLYRVFRALSVTSRVALGDALTNCEVRIGGK